MGDTSPEDITMLLTRWSEGDEGALNFLTPLIYGELRRRAAFLLRNERPGHTLQATALVNEVYLKLEGQAKMRWQNRTHFFAVAARAMRQILIDYARRHGRGKRGGSAVVLPLDEALVTAPEISADLLLLDEALERLLAVDPRKAKVVELRFFGGLENHEVAEVLKVSPNTVMRDWNLAKAWLRREMENPGAE
jgi:RNA polymerase sigma-70 factor (ECF subfamily)